MVNSSQKEQERRQKISQNNARYWLGKKRSMEDKEKMRLAKLGKYLGEDNPYFGKKHSKETREKLRLVHLGKPASHPFPKGHIPWNKGLEGHLSGEKHYNWQGGITPKNIMIRHQVKYRFWRESVFKRDNFTCQECGARGVELNADHIKPFAYFLELRHELSNGRTLCVPCHKKTPTFSGRAKKFEVTPQKEVKGKRGKPIVLQNKS